MIRRVGPLCGRPDASAQRTLHQDHKGTGVEGVAGFKTRRADQVPVGPVGQSAVDRRVDPLDEEPDRAVAEEEIGPIAMVAPETADAGGRDSAILDEGVPCRRIDGQFHGTTGSRGAVVPSGPTR